MSDIKIDGKAFQERINHFATAWKNDLRSKDGLFGGASSIVIAMGKVEEVPEFHKNNAMHVRLTSSLPKCRWSCRVWLTIHCSSGF
jgi:nucleosome binding factor SPN SPT16 subunit